MKQKTLYDVVFVVLCTTAIVTPAVFGQTIIVTGGAGFIGSHVAQRLLERGDTVIVIDSLNDYYNPKLKQLNLKRLENISMPGLLRFHHLDICEQEKLNLVFEQEKPDMVCHLAARAGVRASVLEPELYFKTNVLGTLYIYEAAVKFGVPHIVTASSSSVYGNCIDIPFCEDYKADKPCSPYAATKRSCELLGYNYHYLYGISTTLLRFFTVYGPSGRPDMAPFKFMDLMYHDKPIQQYGNGMSMRDFTYVDDIVDGIILALDTPLGFEVLNLGRGEPIYLKYFITTLESVIGKKALIQVVPAPKGDVEMTHADISKARMLLGYNPRVSLSEGISRMYEWYTDEYLMLERRLKFID